MRGFIILLFILLLSCETKNDIDISKYSIITTAKDLTEFYDLSLDTSGFSEESSYTKYLDGSFEFEYIYDLLETEKHTPLFYSINITKEKTVLDAKKYYNVSRGTIKIISNTFGQGTYQIDSLDLPGDDSYYAIRTYDGEPNGVLFTLRKGQYIYDLILSGIYAEDHSLILDLIIPAIKDLDNFQLKE